MITITEIMYHPRGGGQELEFVELFNASPAPIDLSGWFFSRGISFTFPDGTWLDGKTYLVVAADAERIRTDYGIDNVLGNWASCPQNDDDASVGCALANGGEALELSEHNGVVHARVRYDDRGSWPTAADGTGHSLEIETPYREQDDPDSWLASGELGGSPGRPNRAARELADRAPVRINEALLLTDGPRWIEIYNESDQEVDLSGFHLTNDRADPVKHRIPDGTVIPPLGWLTFSDEETGLDLTPLSSSPDADARTFIALVNPEATHVVDAYIFEPEVAGMSEARIPDGDDTVSERAEPTPGAANRVNVERDVVINEIMYHPIDENDDAEYIELYNRGDRAVDLTGWRVSGGIDFRFPPGRVIGAGEYLVVARTPDYIKEVYGLTDAEVIGPDPADEEALRDFGRLRNSGERVNLRDANDNRADTVRYHDGGWWSGWADGGGSSLELVDASQDNNVASAWDASDDSGKAVVTEHSYSGNYVGAEPELRFILLGSGITILDDLRMFRRETVLEPIETFVEVGDDWRYHKGRTAPSPTPEGWRQPGFDDSSWLVGPTPIGFGEDDEATVLDDMVNPDDELEDYVSVFFRKTFTISDLASVESLVFEIEYDDGYIAYLNGRQISVQNMRDGEDTHTDTARSSREKATDSVDLTDLAVPLVEGENVLAVQVHNSIPTSRDFRFIPRLLNGRFVNQDGPNQVENGDFEEELMVPGRPSPGFWYIEGTHDNSGRTTRDPITGSGSLKIAASGRGDNKVNRLEVSLPPLSTRPRENTYTISFKSRWVVGAQTLLLQGYDQSIPRAHSLGVPLDLGTPGAPNSVTLRRMDTAGTSNTGPVIDKVEHSPPLPRSGEDTVITARASDPDGVRSMKVFWSLHAPRPPDSADLDVVEMTGPDARGRYTATIPGQNARTRVVYYIVAEDENGLAGRFPPNALDRTHPVVLDRENAELRQNTVLVYRHDIPVSSRYLSYRFWMHQLNENYMSRRELHSNALVDGTFIFENEDLYYNAKVRFSGSPFARGGWGESFRVALPKDNPLHGAISRFQMEDHQRGGAISVLERLSNYLIRHNQGNIKVPFSYQWLVQFQVNDRVNQVREHVRYPNRELIKRWYPDDDDGDFFEMDDRHLFNDGGSRVTNTDGRLTFPPYASQANRLGLPPEDKELYRWYFNLRQKEALDDYTNLIDLAKVLTRTITPDDLFDEVIWDEVDVEEFLRVWAIRLNTDDWDQWGARRGKNCYLYRPANDGRWVLLPWDMELTYNEVGAFMPPPITQPYTNGITFPEVVRFLNRPRVKRLYYGIMKEMIDHQFNSEFLAPYRVRLARNGLTNLNRMQPGGFIDARKRSLENILRSATLPQVQFTVTTNAGEPITTDQPVVTIEGQAPVEAMQIVYTVDEREPLDPVPVTFSDSDVFGWSVTLPVPMGQSSIDFFAFGSRGNLVGSDQIDVTASFAAPEITSITPERVTPGDRVTILGSGFYEGIDVLFWDVPAVEVDTSEIPGRLTAIVPAGLPEGATEVRVGSANGSFSEPFSIEVFLPSALFVRGDVDGSGSISVTDAVQTLRHLFTGVPIDCPDAADADDNGAVNITDPIVILDFLFRRGPSLPAPFPDAGDDPTEDDLDC